MNENHGPECECCKNGPEEFARKMQAGFDKYGWFAHYVGNADYMPAGVCYHTHGLDVSEE